jgi:hypothetical protein
MKQPSYELARRPLEILPGADADSWTRIRELGFQPSEVRIGRAFHGHSYTLLTW